MWDWNPDNLTPEFIFLISQVGLFSKAAFGLCPEGLLEMGAEPSTPPRLAVHPLFTPQPTLLPSGPLSWDTPAPSLLSQPCLVALI